ncbi:TRAP transporter substrate-binding protein DctP [Brevibacterium litoralis]|uniref:TRAP transporter substrate-binding protein DctP n=1 Tax=Brevibacterium litoralis TaxID=3138935 RepID=UPI0032ECF2A2
MTVPSPFRPHRAAATRPRTRRTTAILAGSVAAGMVLTGCAAGVGSGGQGASAAEDGTDSTGYAWGAPQAEVDAALDDLDPITLTYQPTAASGESIMAPGGTVLAEAIEERSGGKIEVDVVWGQAIAGYTEMHDALADGRVDLAFTLPSYTPAEYASFDAIGTAMSELPTSPFVGELATNAAGIDLAWNTPGVLADFEAQGLVPLIPLIASGGYYTMCSEPVSSAADWDGLQVRVGSAAADKQVRNLGASPVSISFPETYEALQRGTVDCDLGQLIPNVEAGTFEVAPHIGYTTDHSFSRSAGAYLAGQTYSELPVAYQQVVFDSMVAAFDGQMQVSVGGNAQAVAAAKDAGGTITEFDQDVQDTLGEHAAGLAATAGDEVGEPELATDLVEAGETWTARVEELGYTDGGGFPELDEWYPEDTDYSLLGTEIFEQVMLPHRPGA